MFALPIVTDMAIDLGVAERFIYSSARLLDRHRSAVLLHDAPIGPVLAALAAYRNADGGYGHTLEPDARGQTSETTATLHALEVLEELGELSSPLADVSAWVAGVAEPDGGVPFVLPTAAGYPLAPWMIADGGSHVTFGIAALVPPANRHRPSTTRRPTRLALTAASNWLKAPPSTTPSPRGTGRSPRPRALRRPFAGRHRSLHGPRCQPPLDLCPHDRGVRPPQRPCGPSSGMPRRHHRRIAPDLAALALSATAVRRSVSVPGTILRSQSRQRRGPTNS